MRKAFIFDFDGVIVDSERHWDAVQREMYGRLVPGWKDEYLASLKGMSVFDEYEHLRARFGIGLPLAEYEREIDRSATDLYGKRAELIDGAAELIGRLKKRGTPLAIATSSNRNWVEAALRRYGLASFFPVLVTGEEVKGRGKPRPDIYLLAAEKLGVAPVDCVVLEDTANGIKAAKAAGMHAIGLGMPGSVQDLSSADETIGAADELTEEVLKKLME